jgi:hypothetical protein
MGITPLGKTTSKPIFGNNLFTNCSFYWTFVFDRRTEKMEINTDE